MLTLDLGPLALPVRSMLLLLAFAVAWGCGWWVGRRHAADPEPALFAMLLGGLMLARLAFVAQYAGDYAAAPWQMLDIRDGGFLALPGLCGALLVGLGYAWRRPVLRRPLAVGMLAGGLLWGLGSLALQQLERGSRLPELLLHDLAGRPVPLAELAGQPLVVNLWASWCPPCRREMPVLLAARQGNPGVRFLLVNQGEGAAEVARFLAAQGLSERDVLLDSGNRLGQFAGSRALPTTLFYAADGQLRHSHLGELSTASLKHALQFVRPTSANDATH
ncbi:TlpA family protein disulfide reductase [Pseudomonas sp. MAP12]|uniref:TlpA family protein disulfide reductase n=1 Tax=Geopseudomonas aromaticivorans TaxID=2849492 RepID=A0ABS6MZ41_9GAMM|nr:TlpA disulfide reductase family protein [Pseudomonas aromaticivorans]MBV2134076.1 TlpA family protein disulfide reductase [Pseudomonas aromaticivorans]